MIFGKRESDDFGEKPPQRFGLGGDYHGLRPSFDNPMSWSLPLFRFAGITVRLHIIFIIYIAIQLLRAQFSPDKDDAPFGVGPMALLLGCLFVIVLLHEFGHCFACRWTDGVADEILMWPLGGLAYCSPERSARAHFITAAGGPMVNVIICLVAGMALGLITGQWLGVAIPNPLAITWSAALDSWWKLGLYLVNVLSLILLLFNLLPMFPLDGGRLLQAALWPKLGYVTSMRFSVRAGLIGAVLLGVVGAVVGNWMLIAIAVFGGFTCWMTIKQLEYTNEMLGFESDEYVSGAFDESEQRESLTRADKRAAREHERAERESAEVDRILAKIKDSGMESLSRKEKKLLQKATERGKGS